MTARTDLAIRRQETHAAILQAAISEFSAKGLDGATTQGIADRAGMTKTKLHYHIDSKDVLYVQALTHVMDTWIELFHGLDMTAGPEVFFRAYIRRKVDHALAHPELVRLYAGEVMRGAPFLRDIWGPSRDAAHKAASVIEKWVQAGLIRPVDPMLLQFNIWAMTETYALQQTELRFMSEPASGTTCDPDAIAASITDLVLGGLKP